MREELTESFIPSGRRIESQRGEQQCAFVPECVSLIPNGTLANLHTITMIDKRTHIVPCLPVSAPEGASPCSGEAQAEDAHCSAVTYCYVLFKRAVLKVVH